jgi:SAM-dependent methyltransferase
MATDRYFAEGRPAEAEGERLGRLAEAVDPVTARRLTGLGVGPGWECLDVGAGSGGVALWLAGRVAPGGRVVAADVDTRQLEGLGSPSLEVRLLDVGRDAPEPCRYDLVHCRMLLQHLADPAGALGRMAAAVRPGGWLLVEESDWGSLQAADPGHPLSAVFDRGVRSVLAGLGSGGVLDPWFGRRVRVLVEGLGLADVGDDGVTRVGRGGDAGAGFIRMSLEVVRPGLIAAGAASGPDLDGVGLALGDPTFRFVDMTLFGAWGRRRG